MATNFFPFFLVKLFWFKIDEIMYLQNFAFRFDRTNNNI